MTQLRGSGQGKPSFSQNGCGFKSDQNMCLLSDLHYKLIMNQKPQKKGKTVKSSPSRLPVPTQPAALAHTLS